MLAMVRESKSIYGNTQYIAMTNLCVCLSDFPNGGGCILFSGKEEVTAMRGGGSYKFMSMNKVQSRNNIKRERAMCMGSAYNDTK